LLWSTLSLIAWALAAAGADRHMTAEHRAAIEIKVRIAKAPNNAIQS
jgi:hypothetical protein